MVIAQRISLRNICVLLKAPQDPSPLLSDSQHITHNLLRNPLNHPVGQANQLHVQVPNHPHSPRANQANHQHAPHRNIRRPVLRTTMVLIPCIGIWKAKWLIKVLRNSTHTIDMEVMSHPSYLGHDPIGPHGILTSLQ